MTHWKRLWCWERLGAGGEGDDRGWDGWMASLTRWTWVWVNSGSWWWTGRPRVLRFMGSQRVGHDWATNWTKRKHYTLKRETIDNWAQGKLKTSNLKSSQTKCNFECGIQLAFNRILRACFPGSPVVKNPFCKAKDTSSIPGLWRSHMQWGNWAHVPQLVSQPPGHNYWSLRTAKFVLCYKRSHHGEKSSHHN